MKVLGIVFLVVIFGVALANMGGSDDPKAAPSAATIAAGNKKAKVVTVNDEIKRLAADGQQLAVRYEDNPCAAIPKMSAVVDGIDDLVYELQDLGYPNPDVEQANDDTRMKLADLIGACRA